MCRSSMHVPHAQASLDAELTQIIFLKSTRSCLQCTAPRSGHPQPPVPDLERNFQSAHAHCLRQKKKSRNTCVSGRAERCDLYPS
jgi:hypothetical protein